MKEIRKTDIMASKKSKKVEEEVTPSVEPEIKDAAPETEEEVHEVDYKEMFEKCNASLEESKSKYLYLYAEFDNYKKRNRTLSIDKFYDGRNAVLVDLFNVLDNIDRAITCIQDESTREGVLMIKKQMEDVLKKYGVEEIDALGQVFDPKYHNAIMNTPDPENSGKVVNQAQKGYKIGDKVLRYAQVVVAE